MPCSKLGRTELAWEDLLVPLLLLVGLGVFGLADPSRFRWVLQNIRAKGRAWLASAVWRKAVSMVVLLTWSYAPMPSTD